MDFRHKEVETGKHYEKYVAGGLTALQKQQQHDRKIDDSKKHYFHRQMTNQYHPQRNGSPKADMPPDIAKGQNEHLLEKKAKDATKIFNK